MAAEIFEYSMRVLIRDKSKGLYLARRDEWVKEVKEALDFGGAVAAISYASARTLTNIELVHAFPDEQYNFTLPMGDFGGNGTHSHNANGSSNNGNGSNA